MNLLTRSLCLLLLTTIQIIAKPKDYLQACWNKQVKPLSEQTFHFSFQEKTQELEHSFEPWQQSTYSIKGGLWFNAQHFVKSDTLMDMNRTRSYFSIVQKNSSDLLFMDYGAKELSTITKSMVLEQPIKMMRYNACHLIDLLYSQRISPSKESNEIFAVYALTIHTTNVTVFIRKSDQLVYQITTLHHDELFGDVLSTYLYKDYTTLHTLHYPKIISIEKVNSKLKDEVLLTAEQVVAETPVLLQKPLNHNVMEDVPVQTDIKTEKYSNNIHFIELKHTDDKVMVVEFKDFLLVAEAPLNSENGDLIIQEAAKIAPAKPIKYFVFGHYHPHYLGGIRPFIHAGATVICTKEDQDYVRYIASAPHSLHPDKLHQEPKPVLFEEVKDSLTVSDGSFEMKIYFIGKKSQHTNDYLIYYFPSEKLLFEDDLVWIAKQGEIKKASSRQAGLYNAVKALGLDIEIIVQSWPVADYGVKTVIPFSDLEKSMTIK